MNFFITKSTVQVQSTKRTTSVVIFFCWIELNERENQRKLIISLALRFLLMR